VLVVEDDAAVAEVLCEFLAAAGCSTVTVHSGLDALRQAHARTFPVALVDVSLGAEPDGIETADWLRRLFGVRVVFVTGGAGQALLTKVSEACPFAYLVKPVERQQLVSVVTLALNPAQDAQQGRTTSDELRFLRDKIDQVARAVDEGRPAGTMDPRRTAPLPIGLRELSGREWQIIRDLTITPTVQAVAAKRKLSVHTVQNHLKSIFRKLEVHSMAELLSLVLRTADSSTGSPIPHDRRG
jgi:DNA-binding NarL/FixJ family response regulator